MKNTLIALLFAIAFPGCATLEKWVRIADPPSVGDVVPARFEKTMEDHAETKKEKNVSVRFFGVPFETAMRTLSDSSNEAIAWDATLDGQSVVGSFVDQPFQAVLESIGRRHGVSVSRFDGVYYLGAYRSQDRVSAVVRVPPIDRTELTAALSSVTGESGKCSILGSFIWISDTLETVRKIVSDLDEIRKKSERSYIAEVYFIRVNEEDFLKLTGDLRINSVDVFSSSFNVNELFEMFLDADGGIGSSSVDMRPILFLSEGRKAVFEVGSELTRERKAVNEKGIMETTGYEKFKDGVTLSLHLSRISEDRYSVDLDLEVSAFDKTDKNSPIPAKNNSVLKSPGLLAKDASVVYAGSLKRKDTAKLFGLVSLDASKKSEMITIWIRVREVK